MNDDTLALASASSPAMNTSGGGEGCPRNIALYKAAGIAQGANIIRKELGGAETKVRITLDPADSAQTTDRAG